MKIYSESLSSYLSVEVLEMETLFLPSHHLHVEVNDEGFSGLNSEVWVDDDNLKKFVTDLEACEQSRRGEAHLSSMSPDEFELTIENFDGCGHFALTYKIGKFYFFSGFARARLVSGGFDLDSSLFRQIVAEFAALLPAQ